MAKVPKPWQFRFSAVLGVLSPPEAAALALPPMTCTESVTLTRTERCRVQQAPAVRAWW